jgi:hypothetical protein
MRTRIFYHKLLLLHLPTVLAVGLHGPLGSRCSLCAHIIFREREICGSVHLQGTLDPWKKKSCSLPDLQGKKRKHGIWGWSRTGACGSMYSTGATLRSVFFSQVSSSFALFILCSEDS